MFKRIDKWIMLPSISILILLSLKIIIEPEESKQFVAVLKNVLLNQAGFLFIWYGLPQPFWFLT